jgi:phosphopentomutase
VAEAAGKDTTTGHWELAGLRLMEPFPTFPEGFPEDILAPFREATGRGVLGNVPMSGTKILDKLGAEHLESGDFIVYTSGDSVFQIAAHEERIPIDELYAACRTARHLLDPYQVGRVIARPFLGSPEEGFQRTPRRKDFSLDESRPTGSNEQGVDRTLEAMEDHPEGLLFTNLVDFDSLYGHRRDPEGYAACLEAFDRRLPELLDALGPHDLLLLTADHGNDPTFPGTDHTRERVPFLAVAPGLEGVDLGTGAFSDVAATLAAALGAAPPESGERLFGTG